MTDEEILDELHILGQWLQGLGVGPRTADLSLLLEEATRKVSWVMGELLFAWRGREQDERAQRD